MNVHKWTEDIQEYVKYFELALPDFVIYDRLRLLEPEKKIHAINYSLVQIE